MRSVFAIRAGAIRTAPSNAARREAAMGHWRAAAAAIGLPPKALADRSDVRNIRNSMGQQRLVVVVMVNFVTRLREEVGQKRSGQKFG